MASRFVRPDTTILHISKGDTLTVKRRLNAGEQRALFAQMATVQDSGAYKPNYMQIGLARVVAYLVDWSLVDDAGKLVALTNNGMPKSRDEVAAIVDGLSLDDFSEIREAIETHIEAQDAELALEKNGQGIASASPAISSSPVDAIGVTTGSLS